LMTLKRVHVCIKRLSNNEYQKYLNNQVHLHERQKLLNTQAKREQLNEMKTFSHMEKEKDRDEK
jgi:hypothetical protein